MSLAPILNHMDRQSQSASAKSEAPRKRPLLLTADTGTRLQPNFFNTPSHKETSVDVIQIPQPHFEVAKSTKNPETAICLSLSGRWRYARPKF